MHAADESTAETEAGVSHERWSHLHLHLHDGVAGENRRNASKRHPLAQRATDGPQLWAGIALANVTSSAKVTLRIATGCRAEEDKDQIVWVGRCVRISDGTKVMVRGLPGCF